MKFSKRNTLLFLFLSLVLIVTACSGGGGGAGVILGGANNHGSALVVTSNVSVVSAQSVPCPRAAASAALQSVSRAEAAAWSAASRPPSFWLDSHADHAFRTARQ